MPEGPIHPEPGLRRVLAPNPSPMTFRGTNTYILGEGDVAVIDPGPDIPAHLKAILDALTPGERVSHIFVTHSHNDHSPLSRALSAVTGAAVHAFGPPDAGRTEVMERLAARGILGGGEGIDADFVPDIRLDHGTVVAGQSWSVEAVWTPGHTSNHLCFSWNGALFSGDHVMGWASSLISPPDGDLTAFMRSCRMLSEREDRIYYPGHGDPVETPSARLSWLIAHRLEREASILACLGPEPSTISKITASVYVGTPQALMQAAQRNVLAHVIDLAERGLAEYRETRSHAIGETVVCTGPERPTKT